MKAISFLINPRPQQVYSFQQVHTNNSYPTNLRPAQPLKGQAQLGNQGGPPCPPDHTAAGAIFGETPFDPKTTLLYSSTQLPIKCFMVQPAALQGRGCDYVSKANPCSFLWVP